MKRARIRRPERVVRWADKLLHEGHGRRFWATLGAGMPDYEARRASLSELGARLLW